ncbi:TPA: hypothetical protein ACWX5B_000501 [Stenotrophomonas maltophilia]
MAMCPLAADWGNVADWAAVVVGFVAAIATTVVAVFAYRTSKRATEIAEEAARIAAQQHHEFLGTKEANGQVVARIVLEEVSQLPTHLRELQRRCVRFVAEFPRREPDVKALNQFVADWCQPFTPSTEQCADRLHNLPIEIRNELATLIGYSRSLNSSITGIAGLFTVVTHRDRAPAQEMVFRGELAQLKKMQENVDRFLDASLSVGSKLSTYVGADPSELPAKEATKVAS